ncbi:DUF6300 family protein [Micromonospora chokoriensis]
MSGDGLPVDVELVVEPTRCPRCEKPCLLGAWLPYGWGLNDGRYSEGRRLVLLCEKCNRDPHSAALITFFHVHGVVDGEGALAEFAHLVQVWLANIQPRKVSPDAFDADVAAWQRGDLED